MSVFIPFKAYRPINTKSKTVACRPYDVLNAKEAREICKDNPFSFYHVIKPEINFPENTNYYNPEIYRTGKKNFDKLVEDGIIIQDHSENYYVYQIIMNDHKQTGLVGCCSIDDYFNNVIKKHELTRPDKEEDRKNHVRYSKLNYEPVFFAYPNVTTIDELVEDVKMQKPACDIITNDGVQHTIWIVEDANIKRSIENLFKEKVPNIYVADGHHRTAAGALVGKEIRDEKKGDKNDGQLYNYFMAVLFPDNQLNIIDYNRVIKDLNGIENQKFLSMISKNFYVEEKKTRYKPKELHHIGMYFDNKWYKLIAKEKTYNDKDPINILDVTILSKQILEPILDIKNLRTDKRIDFIGGVRGLKELEKKVDSGEMRLAFALYPVSMKQLMDIANNGMIMPPKVTWFEPKLRSGLMIYSLI